MNFVTGYHRHIGAGIKPLLATSADKVRAWFGDRAAREFAAGLCENLPLLASLPHVKMCWAESRGAVHGFALGLQRPEVMELPLLLVASPNQAASYTANTVANGLTAQMGHMAIACHARWLVLDGLPFTDVSSESFGGASSFTSVVRELMRAELPSAESGGGNRSEILTKDEVGRAAQCLYEAYLDSVHPEFFSETHAFHFVAQVVKGEYGPVLPAYLRVFRREGRVAAVGLGTRLFSDVGFVMHLAVLPSHRGQGLGFNMLLDLCAAFAQTGCRQVALAVTQGNPAARLYRRAGFAPLGAYRAYFAQFF